MSRLERFSSKFFVLFIAIFLPLALTWYFSVYKKREILRPLPILGPKELQVNPASGKADTLYHSIPNFLLVSQTGDTITRKDVEGKIFVADFFFTTCQGICKDMSAQLTRVQKVFRKEPDFLILSHTVDPEEDSVSVLAEYGELYGAEPDRWLLLTGDKPHIYELARKGYFVTATEGDGGDHDFIHSEKFILVDKKGRIRGYYDGTDSTEVNRLMEHVAKLLLFKDRT